MPKAMIAALLGLAMAAVPILESGARADMQVPVTGGSLRDDERAAIIDRLVDPPVSGRSLLHELTMQPLELDAKFELWMRSLETAWIADAVDGYADLPPPGSERQEQFRSFRFFARDHWDLRSAPQLDTIFPRAELYREIERQYIPSGRIAMPPFGIAGTGADMNASALPLRRPRPVARAKSEPQSRRSVRGGDPHLSPKIFWSTSRPDSTYWEYAGAASRIAQST